MHAARTWARLNPAPYCSLLLAGSQQWHPLVVADIEGGEGDVGIGDGGGLGRGADCGKVVADGRSAAQVLIHEIAHLAAVLQLALQGKGWGREVVASVVQWCKYAGMMLSVNETAALAVDGMHARHRSLRPPAQPAPGCRSRHSQSPPAWQSQPASCNRQAAAVGKECLSDEPGAQMPTPILPHHLECAAAAEFAPSPSPAPATSAAGLDSDVDGCRQANRQGRTGRLSAKSAGISSPLPTRAEAGNLPERVA